VVKRDGSKIPFDRTKIIAGVMKAIKNRPVTEEQVERLADRTERSSAAVARHHQPGGRVGGAGSAAPAGRRGLPSVIASVYKDFQELTDFERELGILLQKRDPSAGGASALSDPPGKAARYNRT